MNEIIEPPIESNPGLAAIALRDGIQYSEVDGVRWMQGCDGVDTESDRREIDAHARTKASRTPNNGQELFDDLVFKSNFVKTFREVMPLLQLEKGQRVLELGSGHGWASLLIKHFRHCWMVASDLVPESLSFCKHYEALLGIEIDEKWAFNVRNMPFADAQFDRIFTFAAFHHFGDGFGFGGAVKEMLRVLRPSGIISLLYEPSCPQWLYRRAFRRANRRNLLDGVNEDVLVPSNLAREVRSLGGNIEVHYFPEPRFREGLKQSLYYGLLSKAPAVARCLVSTVNIRITHA